MIYQKDNFYHVYNRGCNKEIIFFEDGNYRKLLQVMRKTHAYYGVEILAFCLMPNHYHFLLFQLSDTPISNWLKVIFSSYVQSFNRKYQRSGTLFERSAVPKILTNNNYVIRACHYIHSNPIKHGFVFKAPDWQHSSLNFYLENNFGFISDRLIKLFFTNSTYEKGFEEYVDNKFYNDDNLEKLSFSDSFL